MDGCLFFFNDTAATEIYTLSLHDALPISSRGRDRPGSRPRTCPTASARRWGFRRRSEEHTSELQSPDHLVCRLLLEKKNSHIAAIRLLNETVIPPVFYQHG